MARPLFPFSTRVPMIHPGAARASRGSDISRAKRPQMTRDGWRMGRPSPGPLHFPSTRVTTRVLIYPGKTQKPEKGYSGRERKR
jgi:hypothetical protein